MITKISDIPQCERPQERLLKYGAKCLSNHELIAVILRSGNKTDGVLNLTLKLFRHFGGLNSLLDANIEELLSLPGIKEAKASQLMAISEISKRYRSFKSGDEYQISSPDDAAEILLNEMRNLKQEILKVIILNTKNKIINIMDASIGSLNSSIVHPREIFKDAIVKSAASIILVHNHPSGDPSPSGDDINSTARIKEAGKILGIELLDHIIIGDGSYISLKEKGLM